LSANGEDEKPVVSEERSDETNPSLLLGTIRLGAFGASLMVLVRLGGLGPPLRRGE